MNIADLKKIIRFIEKEHSCNFVNVNNSFVYRMAMKRLAKKCGVVENLIDDFMKKTSMLISNPFKGFPIPGMRDYAIVTSFDIDDDSPLCLKTDIVFHEFQHLLDCEADPDYEKKYIKNHIYRANVEGRGYSAGMEGYYVCTGKIKPIRESLSGMYLLNSEDQKLVSENLMLTSINLEKGILSSESAKILSKII